MHAFSNYLKKIDLFGKPIQFNLHNDSNYKTVVGALMSLISVAFCIFLFQIGAYTLVSQSKFNIQSVRKTDHGDQQIILNAGNFMIAIKNIPEFAIYIEQTTIMGVNRKVDRIPMVQCQSQHFQLLDQVFFPNFNASQKNFKNQIQLSDYLCPPISQQLLLKGQNSIELEEFSYFEVIVEGEQEQPFEINPMLISNFIDPTLKINEVNPLFINDLSFVANPQTLEGIQIKLEQVSVYENNILMSQSNSQETQRGVHIESVLSQQQLKQKGKVFSIKVSLSQSALVYIKQYQTVDQFLSYMGGIIKVLFLIIGICVRFYNEQCLYLSIANNLYNFSIPNTNTLQGGKVFSYEMLIQRIKRKLTRVQDLLSRFKNHAHKVLAIQKTFNIKGLNQQHSIFSQKSKQHEDSNQQDDVWLRDPHIFLDQVFTDMIHCQTTISMTIKYFWNKIFCGKLYSKDSNVILIDRAISMVKNDMDILVVMDRLQELDKLKRIIMNENQQLLFDYSPKPLVRVHVKETNEEVKLVRMDEYDREQDRKRKRKSSNFSQVQHNRLNYEKRQSLFTTKPEYKTKKALLKLFGAYRDLVKENRSIQNEKEKMLNQKLMQLLGRRLVDVFETSFVIADRLVQRDAPKVPGRQVIDSPSIIMGQSMRLGMLSDDDNVPSEPFTQKIH